jgi:hypothetical protein
MFNRRRFITRLDGDGLDPMKRVLKHEVIAESEHHFMRQHRVARRRTDVQEKGAVRL